jgi:hypothetical protein
MSLSGNISACLYLLLVLSCLAVSKPSLGQKCYKKTINPSGNTFVQTLHYPEYKGEEKELSFFLAKTMEFGAISSIQNEDQEWQDSVGVRFVIGKDNRMSDLMIESRDLALGTEVEKAFKKSACNWRAGGTERLLNVWYACVVYVRIEKRANKFVYTVSIIPRNPTT